MKLINFQTLTITDMVLLAVFSVVFLIQIYYLLGKYLPLALHKDRLSGTEPSPVTIILLLRNEETRIRELIARLTEMNYTDYQLVVVNEFSEDNTLNVLQVLAEHNPRIKVTSLSQETRFQEKQALNLALKGASSPWIVQLTPDTHAISPEWLSGLMALTDRPTEAVIGYTNVEGGKGMRNLLCRIERFSQFMVSGSWTLSGSPFVFSEINVLFKKSMYFDTQGFRMKLNRHFANLELIFNENFRNGKVKVSLDPLLSVHEKVEDDRGDHLKLIKKSVQIRQSLSWSLKAGLFMDDLSKILVTVLAAALIILHPEYWITFTILPGVYYILLLIIVKKLLNRLKERKIFVSSFIYILIKPIINWWFFWSTYLIHHRNKWN